MLLWSVYHPVICHAHTYMHAILVARRRHAHSFQHTHLQTPHTHAHHAQLLHEAVHNEDDARWGPTIEEAGPGASELLESLLERQRLIAEGCFDLENSFDDFRLVVGDNTL